MKLEKAIEILEKEFAKWKVCNTWDYCKALKLGIEALKMIQEARYKPGGQFFHDLPGEEL